MEYLKFEFLLPASGSDRNARASKNACISHGSGESKSWFILKANYSPRELEVTETMGREVGRENQSRWRVSVAQSRLSGTRDMAMAMEGQVERELFHWLCESGSRKGWK